MWKKDSLPTEREWRIMEALWDAGSDLTSAEILERIPPEEQMDLGTERVLLHHLCKKGILGYTVDPADRRVYHYYPTKSREACRREKSRNFIDAYFRGSSSGAVAAFLQDAELSDDQLAELEELLQARRRGERQ